MPENFLYHLGLNLSLALALVFMVGSIWDHLQRLSKNVQMVVLGCLFGLAAVASMIMPVTLSKGVFFDARHVLLGLAGLFGGWPAALPAGIIAAVYRVSQAGPGMFAGSSAAIASALIGVAVKLFLDRKQLKIGAVSLFVLGILLAAEGSFSIFLLPNVEQALASYKNIVGPFFVLFPPACVLIGGLLLREQRRRDYERQLRFTQTSIDHAVEAVYWADRDAQLVYVNESAQQALGYSREELLTMGVGDVDPVFPMADWPKFCDDLLADAVAVTFETQHRRKDGTVFPVEMTVHTACQEKDVYVCGMARDITSRQEAEAQKARLESQLRQSQKMEAVGQLAGGIAHDFNNLLQAIQGHTELSLDAIDSQHEVAAGLREIKAAAEHAAALTRQLLAFGRRDLMQTEKLNLNQVVQETMSMLRRLIGEHVELKIDLASDAQAVMGDRSQIAQILLNLSLNARDAMPDGGTLTLETRNVVLDEAFCHAHPGAEPKAYVRLVVRDTGMGIAEDTLHRVCEPFFTTKDLGKGTGLGLATVYAIAEKHGGLVDIASELGHGTSVMVYLPVSGEQVVVKEPKPQPTRPSGKGSEIILLAEDASLVRQMVVQMLEGAGYKLLVAKDGQEAIDLIAEHADEIDLAVIDIVMPRKSGVEVGQVLWEKRPGIPTIFSSGYSHGAIDADQLPSDCEMVTKPYSPRDFLAKVRAMLDSSKTGF